MTESSNTRTLLLAFFAAGVAAVDAQGATAVALQNGSYARPDAILAIGKAAPAMAWGAVRVLGHMPGLVVSHTSEPAPPGMNHLVAGHPIPDQRSIAAGAAVFEFAASMDETCHLMVLISGGASALVESPVAGVSLTDLSHLNEVLLRSGASIDEINSVRGAVSRLKGGGLLQATGARVTTLALSDVVGDSPSVIGSGLTAPADPDGPSPAEVLESYRDVLELPEHTSEVIRRATPRPRPRRPMSAEFHIVASGVVAADAVADAALRRGLGVTVLPDPITGDSGAEAIAFIATADQAAPGLTVGFGETTLVVTGPGTGGRNQHAALTAAGQIEGRDDIVFLAAGTDGRDGPTEAAGAIVDGGTAARATAAGHDIATDLANFDSSAPLREAGDLITTGPTGTNVGDIWMAWRQAP